MPIWIHYGLAGCLALAVLLALIDYFHRRSWPRLLTYVIALAAVALALRMTTGFPFATSRQAFGGAASPLLAVALMFVGVVLGIAATYVFNLTGVFSWRDFVRPLVVS